MTPTLLRTFVWAGAADCTTGRYDRAPGRLPEGEVHLHVWSDATIRELAELVKAVCSSARQRAAVLHMSLAYPDRTGRFKLRAIGSPASASAEEADTATLASVGYEAGDMLDVRVELAGGASD